VLANVRAADRCEGRDVTVELVSIESSQPAKPGKGGKHDKPEQPFVEGAEFGTGDLEFSLRASRHRKDRTYTITYRAIDAAGNETEAEATVLVPHHP
jgi:hypothetical protein